MVQAKPHSSSLQATRQMLDELDILMERMLALPVQELEEPAAPQEGQRPPALAARLTLLAPAVEEAAAEPTLRASTEPSHGDMPPIVGWGRPTAQPETREEEPMVAAPLAHEILPATVLPQIGALLDAIPEPAPRPWASWLRPLLWCNEIFDRSTQPLGGSGRWLRDSGGRIVLGYTGVALLILTVGCLLKDWLGWTW